MKRLLLLTLLSALSLVMKAGDDFSFKYGENDIGFKLVPDKINVRLNQPMTQELLLETLHNSMLVSDDREHRTNSIWILQLDKDYTLEDLNNLISTLDKNTVVDFASPVLDYNGALSAMTTQIIMKLSPDADPGALNDICDADGLTDLGARDNLPEDIHIIQLPKEDVSKQFDYVHDLVGISVYAQPNLLRYMHQYTFNDPMYASQYALTKINAAGAWTHTPGGTPTIKIAVIDVGIDLTHTDLATQFVTGFDATYYPPSGTPPAGSQSLLDTHGGYANDDSHGTMCAGVIAAKANNSNGIVGLAYNCKIMPIRYGYSYNSTTIITDDELIAAAIHYARTQQADVISNSWGGGSPSPSVEAEIHSAILNGRLGKGCPVFFAAGNDGSTTLPWPAYLPDVIAVGATDANDDKASFSNYSTYLDISAPGDGILTTDLSGAAGDNTANGGAGDYTTVSGTSFACPYAAGLMGLILSVNPGLTQADARMVIESTCTETGGYSYNTDPVNPSKNWSDELGYGRINAQAAVVKAYSLLVTTTAPFNYSMLGEPAPACYNNEKMPYFDITVTGGTPITDITNTFKYFTLNYYNSSSYVPTNTYSYINGENEIITQASPGSGISAGNTKRVYLNQLNLLAQNQFPYTAVIYVDAIENGNIHHNLGAITVIVQSATSITMPTNIYGCQAVQLSLQPSVTVANSNAQTAYSWNLGSFTGINTNTLGAVITSPVGDGPVSLTVTDADGCVSNHVSTVHFTDMVISGNATVKKMCTGDAPSPIGASVSGTNGACTYSWSPAAGLSNPNILNPNFTGTATAGTYTYQLTVTDVGGGGCTLSRTFSVDVSSPQTGISMTSNIFHACPGYPVVLTGTFTGPYSTFSSVFYLDGANNIYPATVSGLTATVTVSPIVPTTYALIAVDPYGCTNSNTITVTVNSSYSLSASAGPDVVGCASPLKPINSTVTGGTAPYTYQWMPGNSTTDNISVSGTPQTYTLTVTDNNGCKATDQVAVTSNPAFHPDFLPIYSVVMGQAVQVLPPGVYQGAWTTGGTPPYTYEWTPHHDFTNPFYIWPTTIPLVQTIMPTLTITDANGCQQKLNEYLLTYETPSPPEIYEESDPCSGRQICVDVNPGVGLVYKGDRDASGSAIDLNNPAAGNVYNPEGYVTNSFTYSPAPVSTSANCATFSAGTTAVAITLTQNTTNAMPGSNLQTPPTTFNYTFPIQDNARHLMIALKNNLDMVYVGTDQLLHCYTQGLYGSWTYSKIIPTNGWGSVRVEGWLAQNTNGSRVFFKGTDQHLYSILHNSSTGGWSLESYTIGVTVKSDVECRDGADEVYYVGNDNLLHRIYYASHAWHYEAITPVGGWNGISIDGSIVVEPTPGTHVFFKGNDLQLYNTWGGTLTSPNVTLMPTMNGCAGEVIYNPNNAGLYFKGFDDKIHAMQWNSSMGSWQEGVMNAATSYAVDNYLAFDPAANRLFYQAYDRSIHNIYPYNGQNYDGPIDGGYNHSVAGDVIYNISTANGFYIGQDKEVYEFIWDGTSYTPGWYSHALWYQAPANTYAKTCTNQYRALMTAANPDDDGSGEQPVVSELLDPNSVNVYPNPSEGQFTIEINSGTTAVIDVYNAVGVKVRSIQKEKDKSAYELDLTGAAKGIYMITVLSDGKHTSKKIIIK